MGTIYQSYYTNDLDITDFMVKNLNLENGDHIFEPCGGEGAFIDALLRTGASLKIDTCDVNPYAVKELKRKFGKNQNIKIWEADTLLDERHDSSGAVLYDKIIGNPPYGAWQDYEKRSVLKKKYDGLYAKESYALFLYRCLSLLKEGGRLCFIIPDTFLFLHMHKKLRAYLLQNAAIQSILIFPSKLFPDVSFGYSNLCIITLKKCSKKEAFQSSFFVYKGFQSSNEFNDISSDKCSSATTKYHIAQKDMFESESHALMLGNDRIKNIIKSGLECLGSVADCATGIYTGNNKRFIRKLNDETKNGKGYEAIDSSAICINWESIDPIADSKHFLPFIKGSSSTRFIRERNEWFIDWSPSAISYYKNEKKARFQNSSFYFRKGIALPMIKSKVIKASLMEGMVFDQSIVGVFPKDNDMLFPLLGLLNSKTVCDLLHTINPTANNSSNYLKRIPIPKMSQSSKQYITEIVRKLMNKPNDVNLLERLNFEIDRLYDKSINPTRSDVRDQELFSISA